MNETQIYELVELIENLIEAKMGYFQLPCVEYGIRVSALKEDLIEKLKEMNNVE